MPIANATSPGAEVPARPSPHAQAGRYRAMVAQALTLKGLLLKPSQSSSCPTIQDDEVDEVAVARVTPGRLEEVRLLTLGRFDDLDFEEFELG